MLSPKVLVSITLKPRLLPSLRYNGGKGGTALQYRYYEKIREVREDRGYTQQQLAELLNVGQRTYSDYETGKTRIPLESVRGSGAVKDNGSIGRIASTHRKPKPQVKNASSPSRSCA